MKIPLLSFLLAVLILASSAHAEPQGMAKRLIERLKMERIPQEGAWFAPTYHSAYMLDGKTLPPRYQGGDRAAESAIYALETAEDFSALHRVQTDEIWHFYGGNPLEMLLLYPDGHGEVVVIGPDVLNGQHPQFVVPRGVWQGSRPTGEGADAYAFFGDTLAPGFDYHDFEIGYRDELQKQYPQFASQIEHLTRAEFLNRVGTAPASAPEEAKPAPEAFSQDNVSSVTPAPGVVLRELVGRVGRARSEDCSVAGFTLEPGRGTGTSYNKTSTEIFLVTQGSGKVQFDDRSEPVEAGSVVFIPPRARHSVQAGAGKLAFYAISTPAFSPDDYVVEKAK